MSRRRGKKSPQDIQLELDQADLRFIMSSPQGRRFIYRFLEVAGVYASSFRGEETHMTAYCEGRRSVGTQLLLELDGACPKEYAVMTQEAIQNRSQDARTDDDRGPRSSDHEPGPDDDPDQD